MAYAGGRMSGSVSVVVPVFNGAKYIKNAVENVLGQTYKNIEIIVVDDGSVDHTKKEIEYFIKQGAIKYIYQSNKGLAGARNTGIKNSTGEFIKFFDCDDLLYPEQIERQVHQLENKSDKTVSITDYQLEFESKNKKTVHIGMGTGSQLARFIESNLGPVHAYLAHRGLVKGINGFDENLSSCEDTDFWLRALLHGCVIERLEYTGCCYRILGESMSSSAEKHFLQRCKVFEKLNQALLPGLDRLPGDVLDQLLKSNTKFIHTCLARNIKPASCVPAMIKTGGIIYGMKTGVLGKVFLKTVGFENITFGKFIKNSSRDREYKSGLLNTTAWRDERNYPQE
jgi:glycosyltransferase involved in cell wall biosynthesis